MTFREERKLDRRTERLAPLYHRFLALFQKWDGTNTAEVFGEIKEHGSWSGDGWYRQPAWTHSSFYEDRYQWLAGTEKAFVAELISKVDALEFWVLASRSWVLLARKDLVRPVSAYEQALTKLVDAIAVARNSESTEETTPTGPWTWARWISAEELAGEYTSGEVLRAEDLANGISWPENTVWPSDSAYRGWEMPLIWTASPL